MTHPLDADHGSPGAEHAVRHQVPSRLLHDLRTPINHIVGYSELLIEQAQDAGHDALVPDMRRVRAAGGQLLALINENLAPMIGEVPSPEPTAIESPKDHSAGTPITGSTVEAAGQGLLLVVDDDAANRDVLSRRLTRQGYAVETAENGLQALRMMNETVFDLVLLDIMMPEMDGFDVLRELKEDERLSHIPVIMISAASEIDSAVRCIAMGAEDYLPKPFDPTLLRARTVACLDRKRAHDREKQFTRELQESYQRGQELEGMRDDLTNMIVHDLRTPLTSVITGLQTLEGLGSLDEVQREMLDISLAGGHTLLGMINDLLDISKMEVGLLELDIGEINVAELVGSAVQQVSSLASAKSVTLITAAKPGLDSIPADGDKLLRILVNLLSNAVKFTPAGGSVTVAARAGDEHQSVLFSVSDTGEGIPEEAFGRIFEKFGQVETRKAGRKASTGLGLTFCKLATEAHGGRIWVESEPRNGSTFYFTIPAVRVLAAASSR